MKSKAPAVLPITDLPELLEDRAHLTGLPDPDTNKVRNANKNKKRHERYKLHPDWHFIHHDIVTSALSPADICLKYDLRNPVSGCFDVYWVTAYRKRILTKYKDLLAVEKEMEQEAMRNEIFSKIRHVYDSAAKGYELAKSQTEVHYSRGKQAVATTIPAPHFGAMKDQQDVMLNAGTKLAELAGIGPTSQPTAPLYQDNRQVTILALPKAEGVPSRAPMKVLEAQR